LFTKKCWFTIKLEILEKVVAFGLLIVGIIIFSIFLIFYNDENIFENNNQDCEEYFKTNFRPKETIQLYLRGCESNHDLENIYCQCQYVKGDNSGVYGHQFKIENPRGSK